MLRSNFYKILKYFILANFLLPYSLTCSLMCSVKHSGKPATVTASLLWQKWLKFRGKKPFKILNAYMYALFSYRFSFDPSLWWPLLLSPQRSCMVSHIASGFPHHVINVPQQITIFPDDIIAAQWCLPVCCNRESTERVLELPVTVYANNLEGGDPFDMQI